MSSATLNPSKDRVEGRSPSQMAWQQLRQDRSAKISASIIGLFLFLALTAPVFTWIMHTTPDEFHPETLDPECGTNPIGKFGGISGIHWFGVEPRTGRDVFLRFVFGARTSLTIALTATLVATVIGIIVGLISGFFGGKTDLVLSRSMEITLAFPSILFALAITPVLENVFEGWGLPPGNGTRIPVMILVLSMFGWPYIARIVRGQVISLREREFVEAARALGASKFHLVFNQILPNLWAPILVTVALNIPTLTFLGAGVIDPTSDWGAMLLASVPFYNINPTFTFIPGFALFVLVLSFSLLGDSIRDALDPRSSR